MLYLAPENKFSRNYHRARERFLQAATRMGASLTNFSAQPDGVEPGLTTDIAWFGVPNPRQVLLIVSGIHGVEGFAGSALQLGLLEHLPELPDETALILVHVLNPYGMHNLRRVNANNVDLNRNFIFDPQDFKIDSPAYTELDAFLNPPHKPTFDLFGFKLWLKSLTQGKTALTQAIAGGQYQYPKGLFYGGDQLQPEAAAYMAWLRDNLPGDLERLMVFDVHTGLGALGEQTLFLRSDSIDHKELSGQLRHKVHPDGRNAGPLAYDHEGGSSGVYKHLFPAAERTCLTIEYGTLPSGRILQALRAENQYHQYGDRRPNHWSKKKLKDAFCPYPDIWRKQVVIQGIELVGRAVDFLKL